MAGSELVENSSCSINQVFLMPLSVRQRTIHNKNGAKRSTSFKGKRASKSGEG